MKCFNPKVLGGLALTGLAVFLVAPGAFSAVLPLLVVAACPLSMLFMMRAMSGGQCSTRGSEAGQERRTDAALSSTTSAEAEIARLRAEVDQLKVEKAARSDATAPTDIRAGDSST